ncbi:hypothetical protein ACBI99_29505, partial [Nonomuraea sp. ATR24]|uniref:hypothetical protein n=1 Tax=Nonomuraea sp. ATR24 TaxID=1676744 RepID=UPI0035C206D4
SKKGLIPGNIISVIFDEVLHEKLHALAFDTLLSSQETDACSPALREARSRLSQSYQARRSAVKPEDLFPIAQPI